MTNLPENRIAPPIGGTEIVEKLFQEKPHGCRLTADGSGPLPGMKLRAERKKGRKEVAGMVQRKTTTKKRQGQRQQRSSVPETGHFRATWESPA